jgi:hypothetical protein
VLMLDWAGLLRSTISYVLQLVYVLFFLAAFGKHPSKPLCGIRRGASLVVKPRALASATVTEYLRIMHRKCTKIRAEHTLETEPFTPVFGAFLMHGAAGSLGEPLINKGNFG